MAGAASHKQHILGCPYHYRMASRFIPGLTRHQTASLKETVKVLNHFFPLTPMCISGTYIMLYLCFVSGSDTAQCRRLAGFHRLPRSQNFLWHVRTRSHLQATEKKKSALSAGMRCSGGSRELLGRGDGFGRYPPLLDQGLCWG